MMWDSFFSVSYTHLVRCGKAEGAAFDMMGDDEAVDVAQRGGGVEEGQLLFRLFVDEEKHLLCQQGEKLCLVLVVQGLSLIHI